MCPSSASGLPPPRDSLPTLSTGDDRETFSQILSARVAMPRDRGVLIRISGVEAGRVISLDPLEPTTLGRSRDCRVRLDDASLSRAHAEVTWQGDGYAIADLQSRNGTFRNDERVDRVRLRDGDRVRLGDDVLFRFQIVDEEEERVLRRVYESSILDGLTGIHNRKYLDERIVAEVAYAARHGECLSLILIDLDRFKSVNDTHGHAVGDTVLKSVAVALKTALRSEDLLARYGGEEIAVLARGIDLASARRLAERLREVVEQLEIHHDALTLRITASLGVASLHEVTGERNRAALLALTDERLYDAKARGRNRVVGLGCHQRTLVRASSWPPSHRVRSRPRRKTERLVRS